MMLKLLMFSCCLWVAESGLAGTLHKCRDAAGHISFSDVGCAPGSEPRTYRPRDLNLVQDAQLRDGERRMLERLRRREAQTQRNRQRGSGAGLDGFERRQQLRELRIKRRELEHDLRFTSGKAERRALRRRIAVFDRLIGQLIKASD